MPWGSATCLRARGRPLWSLHRPLCSRLRRRRPWLLVSPSPSLDRGKRLHEHLCTLSQRHGRRPTQRASVAGAFALGLDLVDLIAVAAAPASPSAHAARPASSAAAFSTRPRLYPALAARPRGRAPSPSSTRPSRPPSALSPGPAREPPQLRQELGRRCSQPCRLRGGHPRRLGQARRARRRAERAAGQEAPALGRELRASLPVSVSWILPPAPSWTSSEANLAQVLTPRLSPR